jgi:putative ABC transport system permease protein
MERTRQIGILKSLGATDTEVMKVFVIEASIIGLIGGIIGALLGLAVSQLISIVGGFITVVTPQLFIESMLFAVIVGAVSGYFPAKRAAALQPVEALRYE